MRKPAFLIAAALTATAFTPLHAAVFGNVVPLIGHAADIVLDEPRGVLYVANFTANRIEVMSTADNTVRTSINVANQPGGLALSPDGRYLLVTNYGGWTGVPPASANLVTLIDLVSNGRQTFSTGAPPLSAAFVSIDNSRKSGLALISTTEGFYLFDPVTGSMESVGSVSSIAASSAVSLPAPQATFPPQIVKAAMTTSADGKHIWGIADGGTGSQLVYLFDGTTSRMTAQVWVTSPSLLPRVSASADGSYAMIGWAVFMRAQCGGGFMIRSRYPTAVVSTNVTGHATDSKNGTIYAQIPDGNQPGTPPSNPTTPAGQAPSGKLPAFSILESDNLTQRDKIYLPENMTGRAVLNSANSMMYAISESGVMVLPVGSMGRASRLAVSTEDVLVQSNFCNRNAMKQTFVVSDPGGNRTNFAISTTQAGVVVSPSSGATPATVTVTVDLRRS